MQRGPAGNVPMAVVCYLPQVGSSRGTKTPPSGLQIPEPKERQHGQRQEPARTFSRNPKGHLFCYFAEKKILSALPKMAKAAQSEELKSAFENHETETEQHVARLEKGI